MSKLFQTGGTVLLTIAAMLTVAMLAVGAPPTWGTVAMGFFSGLLIGGRIG